MADTSFSARVTRIVTAWAQAVNDWIYKGRNPVYVTSAGTGSAYTVTLPATSFYSVYTAGDRFSWKAHAESGASATLTLIGASTLAAKNLLLAGSAVVAGAIQIGDIVEVTYDGTSFQITGGTPLYRFIQSGSGAVTRDVQGRLRDTIHVFDFIPTVNHSTILAGTETSDLATYIQAALTAAAAAGGTRGATVFCPSGLYTHTGVTLPGTAQSGGNVTLEGSGGTVFKALTGTSVLVNCPEDIARDGPRFIRNIRLDGNGISGVIGLKAYQVLHLYLEGLDVRNCDVAYQLETIQEMMALGCVARGAGNNVGWLIKQNPAGCTSSTFIKCSAQSSAACGWAFIGDGGGASLETITMYSCLVQSNAPVGMYLKNVSGLTIHGTHFEANARTGTTASIDGNTVSKSVIYADNAFFSIRDTEIKESHSGNTNIIQLTNGSTLLASNLGANGAPPNSPTIKSDSTSGVVWEGTLRQGCAGGYNKTWPRYITDPFNGGGFCGHGAPVLNFSDEITNEATSSDETQTHTIAAGATDSGVGWDTIYGRTRAIQFAASAGSSSTNRTRFRVFAADTYVASSRYVISWLMKASVDTTLRLSLGTIFTPDYDVDMKAGEWTRICYYVIDNAAGGATTLFMWPTDSAGALVTMAKLCTFQVASGANLQKQDLARRMVAEGLYPTKTAVGLRASVLNTAQNATGNVGTGEDNLMTYSLPAAMLNTSGSGVRITAWGTAANNANAKTLKLYFGSQIYSQALTVSQVGRWRFDAEVFRTGSNTQEYAVKFFQDGTTQIHGLANGALTETDTAVITIKCTGEATNNNDIVQEGIAVELLPR